MKTTFLNVLVISLVPSLQPPALFAQGSLTPPGAPAPTMESLDQIEARTPIPSGPFTISQPRSYYLTANLMAGSGGNVITIATNGGTLDLNGFTLSSTNPGAVGHGIFLKSGLSDLAIFNGHICGGVTNNGAGVYSGVGFNYGIYYSGTPPVKMQVSHVSVSGCQTHGIYLGNGDATGVESGTVRTVGSVGICAATVKSSMAVDCGGTAIAGSPISDCRGQSSGSADGVDADTALNCEGFSASRYGIYAWKTAIGCYGETSSDINPGLYARKASVCTGSGAAGGKAIAATLANGCSAEAGTSTVTYKYNMP